MTRYVYDDTGRLVESVTTREPEYRRSDVDRMIALRRLRADLGRHGQPMSEATDQRAGGIGPDAWTYKASGPYTDHAQAAMDRAMEAYYKANPNAPRNAQHWTVNKVKPGGTSWNLDD